MVFGGTSVTPLVDLGSLAQYVKPTIKNLGVKVDSELKLDSQIKAGVKSSFFKLRQLAKIKPVLQKQHFETVIHVFLTTQLDYCNALYMEVSGSSGARFQLMQNTAAHLLTGTRKHEHIYLIFYGVNVIIGVIKNDLTFPKSVSNYINKYRASLHFFLADSLCLELG